MDKFLLSIFTALLCLLPFKASAADYTIDFGFRTSDSSTAYTLSTLKSGITSGQNYITELTNATKAYPGKSGAKLGSKGNGGTLEFTTTISMPIGTSITVTTVKYGTEAATLKVNNSEAQDLDGDLTYTLKGASSSLKFETSNRSYISSIAITLPADDGKCKAPVFMVGDKTLGNDETLPIGSKILLSSSPEDAILTYTIEDINAGTTSEVQTYDANNGIVLPLGLYNLTATAAKDGSESASSTITNLSITKKTATLSFAKPELTVYLSSLVNGEEPAKHMLVYPDGFPVDDVVFTSSKPEVASIDDLNNEIIFHEKGQTNITASFAGNNEYEATEPASYTLKVELTKPGTQNFTLKFKSDANKNASESSDITTSTQIKTIFDIPAGEEADYMVTGKSSDFSKAYYNTKYGLRLGASSNAGNITFTLNKEYPIKAIAATVTSWNKNGTVDLTINDIAQSSTTTADNDYTTVLNFDYSAASNVSELKLSTPATSGKNRIFIQGLDITVGSAGLDAPVPFNQDGEWIAKESNGEFSSDLDLDFLRLEHDKDVKIYYIFEAAPANNAMYAPARVESASTPVTAEINGKTYTKLDTAEVQVEGSTSKVSGIFYPYGISCDQNLNGGTLEVIAKKGDVVSAPLNFNLIAVPTGVEGVEVEAAGAAEYYTLQGVRVQNPNKGIYIRVINGRAVKVVL